MSHEPSHLLSATTPLTKPVGMVGSTTQPVPSDAATSLGSASANAEALARLDKLAALLKQDAVAAAQTAPVISSKVETADEESLQAYLDRFMERTIGKKSEPANISPEVGLTSTAVLKDPVIVTPPREPTRAPECRDQLAAMRAVANQNARDAVAQHASRDLTSKAAMAFVVATAVSLLSCGLAAASLFLHTPAAAEGASILAAIALILAGRFFGFFRQMAKAQS